MIGLSEEVLKELPEQIVDYMVMHKIMPAFREVQAPMSAIGYDLPDKIVSVLMNNKEEAKGIW